MNEHHPWLLWGLDGCLRPWAAQLLPRTLDRLQPGILLGGTNLFHFNPNFPGTLRGGTPSLQEPHFATVAGARCRSWEWDRYDANINQRVRGRSKIVYAPNRARALSQW